MTDVEAITAPESDVPADMFEDAGKRVVDKFSIREPNRALDPTAWIGIIKMLMEIFAECREQRSAAAIERMAKSGRRFVKVVTQIKVRRQMIDDAFARGGTRRDGVRDYRAYGHSVALSMLDAAQESVDGEVAALVNNLP